MRVVADSKRREVHHLIQFFGGVVRVSYRSSVVDAAGEVYDVSYFEEDQYLCIHEGEAVLRCESPARGVLTRYHLRGPLLLRAYELLRDRLYRRFEQELEHEAQLQEELDTLQTLLQKHGVPDGFRGSDKGRDA